MTKEPIVLPGEFWTPLDAALDVLTRDELAGDETGGDIIKASRHFVGYAAMIATGNAVMTDPLDPNRLVPIRLEDMPEMPVKRTIEQNVGILDILSEYDVQSEAVHYQVHLGNLAQQFVDAKTVEEQAAARTVISAMYNRVHDRSQVAFVEGLGFALGECLLEAETARMWRDQVDKRIDSLNAPQLDRSIVHAALTESTSPEVDLGYIKEVLHRTPLLDVDVEVLRDTMRRYDIESLVGKSAELMDYLQTRRQRKERPAEVWLKCEKALSFYAPFLFLCGYESMAAELQGLAHEFFYDDNEPVRTEAKKQWELSLEHRQVVDELMQVTVATAFDEETDGPVTLKSRVKTLGSYERKLAEYMDRPWKSGAGRQEQPVRISDGIASRIILDESIFNADSAITIAERVKEALGATCLGKNFTVYPWHMSGKPEKDYVHDPKPNGYEAYHLNYILQLEDGTQAPFEVQIVNKQQYMINTHGTASHVVGYKGPSTTSVDRHLPYRTLDDLFQFLGRRGHLDRDRLRPAEDIYSYHTAINPNTLPLLLRAFPELPTALQETYAVNRRGYLVPKELAEVRINFDDVEAPRTLYLPPNHLSVEQFQFMVGLIDSSFRYDSDILKAIEWAAQLESDNQQSPRRDGSSTLEGHLLPTAFYAALLASASGRRYNTAQDEVQFMKKTILSALLHDIIEDHFMDDREQGLDGVRQLFNTMDPDTGANLLGDEVAGLVEVLTLPDIDSEVERRMQYTSNLKVDLEGEAMYIKLADRMSNHVNDLVQLKQALKGDMPPAEKRELLAKATKYFMKTDKLLTVHFDRLKSHYPVYGYVRALVWAMRDSILNDLVPTTR